MAKSIRDIESWGKWSKHVLLEIVRLDEHHEKMEEKLRQLELKVAKHNAKAAVVWAMLGAAIPTAIMIAALVLQIMQ